MTPSSEKRANLLTPSEFLNHWLGHRNLTRRYIEAFPEKELFTFSIGGMRTFSQLSEEMLAVGPPGLKAIVGTEDVAFTEDLGLDGSKTRLLALWDQSNQEITQLWEQLPDQRFNEVVTIFGQYTAKIWDHIFYFIDNEVHHRAQGSVYLRALGIEPPKFWER